MNFVTRFTAILVILVLAFSAFAMAITFVPKTEYYCSTYLGKAKCTWREVNPNASGEQTRNLVVKVIGWGNPQNVKGKIYAQVGLGPGGFRGEDSSRNGTLTFKLKSSRWYFLVLEGNGRTAIHPFIFLSDHDTTITRFV